jgi:hypothetical protein
MSLAIFTAPRKKGLRWEGTDKDNLRDMIEFNPNEAKLYVFPMICDAKAKRGVHRIEIWVDYVYTGQALVRTFVGSRKRGMLIKAKIQ